jgi:hypothetical protein
MSGNKILDGAREALAFATAEQPAARITIRGHAYVPEAENEKLRAALIVAQEYLSLSLGSPAYKGPNPYPIIAAALGSQQLPHRRNRMAVGKWNIEVSGPYPCWCRITYDDQEIHSVRHTELRDLEYALQRAIKECRDRLPPNDKSEID